MKISLKQFQIKFIYVVRMFDQGSDRRFAFERYKIGKLLLDT